MILFLSSTHCLDPIYQRMWRILQPVPKSYSFLKGKEKNKTATYNNADILLRFLDTRITAGQLSQDQPILLDVLSILNIKSIIINWGNFY